MNITKAVPHQTLWLGMQGEHKARSILFPLSDWKERYGSGVPELLVQRTGDDVPYPVPLEIREDDALWHVSGTDTAKCGYGKAILHYYADSVLVKSEVWSFCVSEALEAPSEEPPAPHQDWVSAVTAAGARCAEDAAAGRAAAERAEHAVRQAEETVQAEGQAAVEAVAAEKAQALAQVRELAGSIPAELKALKADTKLLQDCFVFSPNLFDASQIETGYYLLKNMTWSTEYPSAFRSAVIHLDSGTYTFSHSNVRIGLYDRQNQIYDLIASQSPSVPRTIAFAEDCDIVISGQNQTSLSKFMLVKGEQLPDDFQPYSQPYLKDASLAPALKTAVEDYERRIARLESEYAVAPTITCIGDSLTAGSGGSGTSYPAVLQDLLTADGHDLTVVNRGGTGENFSTILARLSAMPIRVNPFTLPADGSPVPITFRNSGTEPFNFHEKLRGVNPCTVGGIPCTLNYSNQAATLQRITPGHSDTVFSRTMPLIPDTTLNGRGTQIAVCWIGSINANYTAQQIIDAQRLLYQTLKTDKILFVGLTYQNRSDTDAVNQAQLMAWGNQFLDLKAELLECGLADAGISPTPQDTADLANGIIPSSLRSDAVYFNAAGYTVIAGYIYQKLKDLNWV